MRRTVSALRSRHALPRLLVIDMTASGNGTATGEIKSNLLKGWPQDAFLQLARKDSQNYAKVTMTGGGYSNVSLKMADGMDAIRNFGPDIVLCRPLAESPELNSLALEASEKLGIPVVTWIMDDWPARLEAEDPDTWGKVEPVFRALIDRSAACLSISEAMSEAFAKRYGKPFQPFANGIALDDWPTLARPARSTFVVRYAGGIAPDMNRASLLRVAQAVDVLAKQGVDIRFEISTQKWWLEQCKDLFAAFPTTTLELADKTASDYRRWIGEADLLLIAYNFDEQSLKYVQYSIANKMPECLASGVPVLIHGPKRAATVAYLSDGLAHVVAEPDVTALVNAIKELQASPKRRAELAAAGRARASDRHNIHKLREKLGALIAASAWANGRGDQVSSPSVMPLPTLSGGGGTQSSLLALTAEVLLGKRDATTFSDDPALKAMLALAEQELGTDDPAVRHLRRVETFSRRERSE
jgi:glycosyltransferase involved in cell wall biosynthesis